MRRWLHVRGLLKAGCVGLCLVTAWMLILRSQPASLGLLVLVPLVASLAWADPSTLLLFFLVCLLLGAVAPVAVGSQPGAMFALVFLMGLVSAIFWICYQALSHESMIRHTERQILEDLEDEVVALRQEIDNCDTALLTSQNRQKQYTLLNETSRLLGSSLDLEQLSQIILDQMIFLLGHKAACFTLFVFDKSGTEILRRQKDAGAGFQFPQELACEADEINRWALSRGTPLIIRSLARDFRFKGLDMQKVQGRCFLVSPLVMEGRNTGLVRIEAKDEELFDTEDQRLLESFSGLARLALESAKLYKETQELAVTDGLTKLLLRRTLLERLEEELKRSEKAGQPLALLFLDIDHFKKVNDQYGHPAGDYVLREVAGLVKGSVRDVDLCGRYGGEEFAILLPATQVAGARVVAERIREVVASHSFRTGEQKFELTVSLGIAVFPEDARGIETLLQRADLALYHSKQNGRNRVTPYSELPPSGKGA